MAMVFCLLDCRSYYFIFMATKKEKRKYIWSKQVFVPETVIAYLSICIKMRKKHNSLNVAAFQLAKVCNVGRCCSRDAPKQIYGVHIEYALKERFNSRI
ncbi:hypothetical protein L1987_15494 [Smallanthus sonchifolius]|uniref:Uncharacterized protein n=1 Tax=Smallanthus sonchifolius TaxID=185202 RepID=A0ACB9J639_9ASTR|nr:hypothetical protein L1987_15494 [Smallanthus sonchifolius]